MSYRFRTFAEDDTAAVVALWEACGLLRPWNDPYRDIARKTAEQPELFLVAESTDATATDASATAAPAALVGRRHGRLRRPPRLGELPRRPPDHQGTGLGRAFMAEFERLLLARGCPKVNVQVRAGNERVLGFYASLGYAEDHAVSLGKRLIADD